MLLIMIKVIFIDILTLIGVRQAPLMRG